MASTIPDFLTRYLPRMEFIDTHYVYGGCGGSRSLNPARATDFPTTLCFHSQYKLLQSGIRLYHILFRLRQLVYTLYTFTIATLTNIKKSPLPSYGCLPNRWELLLIQLGVVLVFHRISQLLLLSFPTRHSRLLSTKKKVCLVYQFQHASISHFLYILYIKIPKKSKFQCVFVAKHPIHKCPLRGDFECWFARTIHSISYSRKFSLEEWKTTNYRRCISSSNGCIFTGTAEFLVPSHTPPCFMRISFRKIISPSTLHIYYILNFPKIQILFSLSHSIFNHLRRRQAGRLGVDTQERSSLYGQIANFFPSQSLILLSTLKTISLGHFSSSKSK